MIRQPLRRSRVLEHLGDGHPYGRELHVLGVVDSTSDLVVTLARQGAADGLVIAAEGQRKGRGRRGTEWVSPARSGVWVSVLVAPPPDDRRLLAPAVGLAVADAVTACGADAGLKWPNDVLVDAGKVAGCLVDLSDDEKGSPFAVVGIGINTHLSSDEFSREIGHPIASLDAVVSSGVGREALLASVLEALARWLDVARRGDVTAIVDAWSRYDLLTGCTISATDGDREVSGEVVRIDPVAGIDVDTGSGTERLRAETTHITAVRRR